MNNAITTYNVKKTYGKFSALNPVSITVKKGQIYGLIGRNGAGKTTLLRIITGQTLSSSGELNILGETTKSGLNSSRKRTGALIEIPSFYPYLSARKNLEYYRLQRGIAGKTCIDKALELVNLNNTKNKKFKSFSLGMKQRLGLALALLNDPDILILDEPINGLDPIGIAEFRSILLKLNEEKNITIIISSHILEELSSIATNFSFIDNGSIIEEISSSELKSKCKNCIEIIVDNPEKTATLLENKLNCKEYEVLHKNTIKIYKFINNPSIISNLIVENGVKLESISIKGYNLEDYFISLIGGKTNA